MVYFCEGTTSERLKWFEIINIAGETLTPQELKNATFSGTWVSDAKKYFCKQASAIELATDTYLFVSV